MSGGQTRLNVRIDVFEKADQRALPLRELTPPQLVEAILQEFRELEYPSFDFYLDIEVHPLDHEG